MKTKRNKLVLIVLAIFMLVSLNSCEMKKRSVAQQVSLGIKDNKLRLPFKKAVYSIFIDSKGNHWIGSREEGICRISQKIMKCFSTLDGIRDNQIRSIEEDTNGIIWIATEQGIAHYDGEKFNDHDEIEFAQYQGKEQIKWQKSTNEGLLSHGIGIHQYVKEQSGYFLKDSLNFNAQTTTNELWFHAGAHSGAYKYDGKNLSYLPFPLPNNGADENIDQNYYPVTKIYKGKNKKWFSSYSGFFGFDDQTMIAVNNQSFRFEKDGAKFHIRSVFEDSKGSLWIGNNGLGVGVVKYDAGTFFSLTKKNGLNRINGTNNFKPVSNNDGIARVFSINEDNDGNIWFGTRDKGAWRYDGKNLIQFTTKDGLSNNYIRVIYKDQLGQMWFGTGDGSVHQFNGNSFDRVY